jgi:hypothetical protein
VGMCGSCVAFQKRHNNMETKSAPKKAFIKLIHYCTWRTIKLSSKVFWIGKCSNNSVTTRTVRIIHYLVQEFFWSFDATVSVSKIYEKYLFGGESLQTGQRWFGSVGSNIVPICNECLSYPSIIGHIFTQRCNTVQLMKCLPLLLFWCTQNKAMCGLQLIFLRVSCLKHCIRCTFE